MNLLESVREHGTHVQQTIVFFDIVDSTKMKEAESEPSWLSTLIWFYDVVTEVIREGGAGTVVKYDGDGVVAAYDEDNATDALLDAIRVQESIKKAVTERHVKVFCSIGIATGEVVEIETPGGQKDYVGTVVDRAARLCSVASAQAIFVDTATTASARMNRVTSEVGRALGRDIPEYQGPVEKATVKGFKAPIDFHELQWASQHFGLKAKVMTAAALTEGPAPSGGAFRRLPPPGKPRERCSGTVKFWNSDRGWGFFVGESGEEFYSNVRDFAGTPPKVEAGDAVFFVPADPMPGKARVATAVVTVGQTVYGQVVSLRPGFAFIRVADEHGNTQDIYTALDDAQDGLDYHMTVAVTIRAGTRGACGYDLRVIDRPAPAEAA